MNRRDALAALGLPADADWSQIEAAAAREMAQLRHRKDAEGVTEAIAQAEARLQKIRRVLFGPLGTSPAFEELLAEETGSLPTGAPHAPTAPSEPPDEFEPDASARDVRPASSGRERQPLFDSDVEPVAIPAAHDASAANEDYQSSGSPRSTADATSSYMDSVSEDAGQIGHGALDDGLEETLTSVGRFVVRQQVARTKHLSVWLAYDPDERSNVFVTRYARSVPREDLDELLQGVNRLTTVDHPHIAKIVECLVQGRRLIVVQEVPRGTRLREELEYRSREARRFPVPRAIGLLDQLCDALTALHRKTYCGGISPEAIWIDNDDHVTLDLTHGHIFREYGLLGPAGESANVVPYLAPEELNPDEQADHRADQYSVAAVTYELLAGGTFQDIRRPLRDVNHVAPRDLSEALGRALSTNVRRRYASIGAFWRACVKKRRVVPISMFLVPAAAAALVLSLSLAYLQYLDPIVRSRNHYQQAMAARQHATNVYREQLTPQFIQATESLAKLEDLVTNPTIGSDVRGSLLRPIVQLKAWRSRQWQILLGQKSPEGDQEPRELIESILAAADRDVERGRKLRSQKELAAANRAFTDAEAEFDVVGKLIPEQEEQENDKQLPPVIEFYTLFNEIVSLEAQLLQSRYDYRTLLSRGKEIATYARSRTSARPTQRALASPDALGREAEARAAVYDSAWNASQTEFVEGIEELAKTKGALPEESLAQFRIGRFRKAHEQVMADLATYREAFNRHLIKLVGNDREQAERALTDAETLSTTLQQLTTVDADAFDSDDRARIWLERATERVENRRSAVERELYGLRQNFFDPGVERVDLFAAVEDASESQKLDWVSEALKDFARVESDARQSGDTLQKLVEAAEQLTDLAAKYGLVRQQAGKAERALRWWMRFDEGVTGDYSVLINQNKTALTQAQKSLEALQQTYAYIASSKADELSAANYAGQLVGLRRDTIRVLADWDAISQSSELIQDKVVVNAGSLLNSVVTRYDDVTDKVHGAIIENEKLIKDLVTKGQVAAEEGRGINRLILEVAASDDKIPDKEKQEKQLREDFAQKEDEARELDQQLSKVKSTIESLRETYKSVRRNSDNMLLLDEAKQLTSSTIESGTDAARAISIAKQLNTIVEIATASLDERLLTETLGITAEINTNPPQIPGSQQLYGSIPGRTSAAYAPAYPPNPYGQPVIGGPPSAAGVGLQPPGYGPVQPAKQPGWLYWYPPAPYPPPSQPVIGVPFR